MDLENLHVKGRNSPLRTEVTCYLLCSLKVAIVFLLFSNIWQAKQKSRFSMPKQNNNKHFGWAACCVRVALEVATAAVGRAKACLIPPPPPPQIWIR